VSVERAAVVIIVGGGVVGSACAYFLAQTGAIPASRILIIEKDPGYAFASTARSAGGLRQQFSTPENIALSQFTLSLVRNLRTVFDCHADVAFREQGYLITASDEGCAILADNVTLQRSMGADIVLLDRDALARRFPWLNTNGIAAGSFGQSGEGWLDPVSLMTLFRKAAQAKGVLVAADEVVAIDTTGTQVSAVRLASGGRIGCGALINAAGPSAGKIAALANLHLPVEPRKRYVYVIDCRKAPRALHEGPLTVDPSGVWFRPEGRVFLCGVSPKEDQEPPAQNLDEINYPWFESEVWPLLAMRVPAFEEVKATNAWAGYYDYNTLDQNAIIGPHPELSNFYFANGFSGHGLQQAAGAGRAVAELIVHNKFQTLDLTRFGYARIAANAPLFEHNVI
jgi:FAD-dependent oxidoreductase domain-containing protein 1